MELGDAESFKLGDTVISLFRLQEDYVHGFLRAPGLTETSLDWACETREAAWQARDSEGEFARGLALHRWCRVDPGDG